MAERFGWALYWVASGIAVLIALGGVALFFSTDPFVKSFVSIGVLVVAALVWGLGRLLRYVLAGE